MHQPSKRSRISRRWQWPDGWLALRGHAAQVGFLLAHQRAHPDGRHLPPPITVVLYHGPEP
ncbi:MAG: hypothetical protein ACPGUV_04590 [Polyangiales bacterium]